MSSDDKTDVEVDLSAVRARADGAPERITLVLVAPKPGEDAMALDSPTWGRQFPRVDYVRGDILDVARDENIALRDRLAEATNLNADDASLMTARSENARLERELAEANHYLKRGYADLTKMNGWLTEARAEVVRLSTALDDIRRTDQGVTFVVDGEKGLHVRGPQEAVDALEMRIATAMDEVERLKGRENLTLRALLLGLGKLADRVGPLTMSELDELADGVTEGVIAPAIRKLLESEPKDGK